MDYYESVKKFGMLLESSDKTITLWHGGNLDDAYQETKRHAKGRWEHGPGLYLTSSHEVAKKYTKGRRKLYRVKVSEGNDIQSVDVPIEDIHSFIDRYVIRKDRQDIKDRLERTLKDGKVKISRLLNLIINADALPKRYTNELREFLVDSGVDYSLDTNTFGWGELTLVLFNMDKLVDKEVVGPDEKISEYDLPKEFN